GGRFSDLQRLDSRIPRDKDDSPAKQQNTNCRNRLRITRVHETRSRSSHVIFTRIVTLSWHRNAEEPTRARTCGASTFLQFLIQRGPPPRQRQRIYFRFSDDCRNVTICQSWASGRPDQEGMPSFRFPFLMNQKRVPGEAAWIKLECTSGALSCPWPSAPWHSAQLRRKSFFPAAIASA